MRLSLIAVGAALMIGASASVASGACKISQVAQFHIVMDGNSPLLAFEVNGRSVNFLVDTGSDITMISRAGAAELGLNAHELRGVEFYGVGGVDSGAAAMVKDVKLGDAVMHNLQLLVFSRSMNARHYVGLLGEDYLSQTDLELDFANGVMRMLKPTGCVGDQVVYWGKAYSLASIAPSNEEGKLESHVSLNGRDVLAQIDTGAYTSVVTTGAAARAGVTPHSEGVHAVDQSGGVGTQRVETSVATFPTFKFGDEEVKNAKLRIADLFAADTRVELGSRIPTAVADFPGMLLGADFIKAHRIYIARSQGKIYFSYNGGPIFQVTGPRADEAPPAPVAAPPPKAAKP